MNIAPYYAPPVVEDVLAAEPHRFEVKRALADAQATYRRNPLALTVLVGLALGLSFACDYLVGRIFVPRPDVSLAASLAMLGLAHAAQLVVKTFLTIGTLRVSLAAARGEPFGLATLFSGGDVVLRAIGSNVMAGLLALMGMLLLVVPGVVLAIALGFTLHLVADRRADTLDSLRLSLRITRGQRLRMLVLMVATVVLLLGGLALLGVGVLITVPIAYLAWAHAYVTIIGE